MPIPKNIYQSWHTKTLHPNVQKNIIDVLKAQNPDYTHEIYTDEEIDKFVQENYDGEILECYNKLNIIVAKVDFWRYLILYKNGGIYLDIDSSINKPIHTFLNEDDDALITREGNRLFYPQWAMFFSKNHPILKKTIELVIDNIKNKRHVHDIHKMTGPTVFTRAVNIISNGKDVISNCGFYGNKDGVYEVEDKKYRISGVDFNGNLSFLHRFWKVSRGGKVHWVDQQKKKSALKE